METPLLLLLLAYTPKPLLPPGLCIAPPAHHPSCATSSVGYFVARFETHKAPRLLLPLPSSPQNSSSRVSTVELDPYILRTSNTVDAAGAPHSAAPKKPGSNPQLVLLLQQTTKMHPRKVCSDEEPPQDSRRGTAAEPDSPLCCCPPFELSLEIRSTGGQECS